MIQLAYDQKMKCLNVQSSNEAAIDIQRKGRSYVLQVKVEGVAVAIVKCPRVIINQITGAAK